MSDRIFYYVRVTTGRYTDGNDCLWVGEGKNTYNIDEAKIFTMDQMQAIKSADNSDNFEGYPVHQIDRLIQLHAPLNKLRKPKEIADGELCYLLSKRDKTGSNAGFWAWNHQGYTNEIRNAQIFKYKKSDDRYNRDFEYYIPVSIVKKKMTQRIDIQDLDRNPPRMMTHALSREHFKEEKAG